MVLNFCNRCSEKLTLSIPEGDDRKRSVCTECGHIHYDNPKVIVGCLPVLDEKILLCRRAIEPKRGCWTLPAGFMENGETAEAGAIRETFEEARAEVEVVTLYAVYSVPKVSQIHLIYLARMKSSEFAVGQESLEVKLFESENLPWKELAFSSVTYSLKCYVESEDPFSDSVHLGRHEVEF